MISSKTSNILITNTCSKQHSKLFPNNLNVFKVKSNNNIQWKNIITVCSEIPFSKNSYHIETSQLTCKALQLTGFYMIRVFSEKYFRRDFTTAFVFLPLQRAHNLTWKYISSGLLLLYWLSFTFRYSLRKICQNTDFLWSVFSRLRFCCYTRK